MNRNIVSEDMNYILQTSLPWSLLDGASVLITGANGMIPGYIAESLLAMNRTFGIRCKVIGFVKDMDRARNRFGDLLDSESIKLYQQDITSEFTFDFKEPVDYVIHAASIASPKYYKDHPIETAAANVFGTKNLLDAAIKWRTKKFLFISSGEVYGNGSNILLPMDEKSYGFLDPLNIRSCYAESKRMGENLSVCYSSEYGLNTTIVRPFHTYGPGMKLDDGRIFADIVDSVIKKQNIILNSDGSAIRSFCYLADAVIGYFIALFKGESMKAYNIGSAEGVSIKDLAERVANLFAKDNIKVIISRKSEANYLRSPVSKIVPDISLIKSLGWNPSVSIEDGFNRTVAYYL